MKLGLLSIVNDGSFAVRPEEVARAKALDERPTIPCGPPDDCDAKATCPECGGEGRVVVRARTLHGDDDDMVCPCCYGEGAVMQ